MAASTSSSNRTAIRAGSSQLVTHVVYDQSSQTIVSRSAASRAVSECPLSSSSFRGCVPEPGPDSRKCESCVTAKTKTRSKKSSMLVTRCSLVRSRIMPARCAVTAAAYPAGGGYL